MNLSGLKKRVAGLEARIPTRRQDFDDLTPKQRVERVATSLLRCRPVLQQRLDRGDPRARRLEELLNQVGLSLRQELIGHENEK